MLDNRYMMKLSGEERLEYLRKNIEEADGENNIGESLSLRKLFIEQALACGDILSGSEMLGELTGLFDEYPEELPANDFLDVFKRVIDSSAEHYQISAEQTDKYLEQFREYLKKYGYSLRPYYLAKYKALINVDKDAALMAFAEAENHAPAEDIGCPVCEEAVRICREMTFGSERRAVELLDEMIEQELRCDDAPQNVYGVFVHEFTLRGMYDEAEHYAGLLMGLAKGTEERFLKELSYVMGLRAAIDPNSAYYIFCKCVGIFSGHKNPEVRFWFADAAQRFFTTIIEHGSEDFNAALPKNFELYKADGAYKARELKDFFYGIAKELAEKFDARNGTSVYSDALNTAYPESPAKEIEPLPLHGSVTPDSPAYGVLFRSLEKIPSPADIADIAEKRFGFERIGLSGDPEAPAINLITETKSGDMLRFRCILAGAPDPAEYAAGQRLPENALHNIGEYRRMLAVMSGSAGTDRSEEIRMLVKLADALNIDEAPVIYDLGSKRILSAKWASLSAESETPPPAVRCVRFYIFPSETVPGTEDISTTGMTVFGSRELAVTNVRKEDMSFTIAVLEKLISEIAINPLRDEGYTMNSGICYDDKEFLRFTWRAVKFSDSSDIYAEPLLYIDPSDDRGVKINEIHDADRSRTAPRKHRKTAEYDEKRNRMLFPQALEYFKNNKCSMTVGVNISAVSEDGELRSEYFHAELLPGGKSGKVISCSEGLSDIKTGDTADIAPESVYFFRIDTESGRFYADDLYALLK